MKYYISQNYLHGVYPIVENAGKDQIEKLLKFGLVGILNTAIFYLSFVLLLFYTNYLISLMISHVLSVTHSFIWNKYWTFKSNSNFLIEYLKFNSVYVVIFILNAFGLMVLTEVVKMDPRIGQLILIPIMTLIGYSLHNAWSFRDMIQLRS